MSDAITVEAEWSYVEPEPIRGRTTSRVRTAEQGELVGMALEAPKVEALAPILGSVPFFCADPVFAGLPGYGRYPDARAADGRSYRTYGHVHWDSESWLRPRFETTVVFPERPDGTDEYGGWNGQTVIHELGHVLEHRLAERGIFVPDWTGDSNPYGSGNSCEAFATAFSTWVDARSPRYLAAYPWFFHPDPPREQMRWFDALVAEVR